MKKLNKTHHVFTEENMQCKDVMPFLRQQLEPLGLEFSFYEGPHITWTHGSRMCLLTLVWRDKGLSWMQVCRWPGDWSAMRFVFPDTFKTVFIRDFLPLIADSGSALYQK